MLVYVWSRRNPYVRMNFFGLLNFQAPFLPWVLMGFSLLLGNSIIVDLLGKSLITAFYYVTYKLILSLFFMFGLHIIAIMGLFNSYVLKDYNISFLILTILIFLPKYKEFVLVDSLAIKILILSLLYFWLTLGIAVGHIYFFLEDVFPNQPGGIRILKTPSIL